MTGIAALDAARRGSAVGRTPWGKESRGSQLSGTTAANHLVHDSAVGVNAHDSSAVRELLAAARAALQREAEAASAAAGSIGDVGALLAAAANAAASAVSPPRVAPSSR
jgi:hypothetical protein